MTDLEKAKEILSTSGCSCVICKGSSVQQSSLSGIAPLIGWIDSGADMHGASAADKIVGKAAALLFSLAGVRAVYAQVMSEKALPVLSEHGIYAEYGTLVPAIINRTGTDICPMEKTVADISDPSMALTALKKTVADLRFMDKNRNL